MYKYIVIIYYNTSTIIYVYNKGCIYNLHMFYICDKIYNRVYKRIYTYTYTYM